MQQVSETLHLFFRRVVENCEAETGRGTLEFWSYMPSGRPGFTA